MRWLWVADLRRGRHEMPFRNSSIWQILMKKKPHYISAKPFLFSNCKPKLVSTSRPLNLTLAKSDGGEDSSFYIDPFVNPFDFYLLRFFLEFLGLGFTLFAILFFNVFSFFFSLLLIFLWFDPFWWKLMWLKLSAMRWALRIVVVCWKGKWRKEFKKKNRKKIKNLFM